ncbi:hypothetical protein FSARC_11375 [Fusarium sarcochroum]|uniref:JmjC domain-containing protein n=1 Tax=Fusarium sarcochroum TaxID=1208366 RepID=A0A8H4X175_9HYPO|nr:hypothetical protein FSARC_11375 [Fusarium sarcochroum]
MSSHDFLVSKCGSLVVTVEQLLLTLTALRTTVSIGTPQKNRPTRFTRAAEQSDNSATDLLWRILPELDCLVDRSWALQSQVEDINGIISRCNDSNLAEWEDGNNTTHIVNQSVESSTIMGSDQQADSAMMISDSVTALSVPLHSVDAEGDDIADYHVTQVPTTPSPAKRNSMRSPNTRPESGTSTRSSGAWYISPASSNATHSTWPESPTCAFGQDASILDAGYTEFEEQVSPSSAENLDVTPSRYEKAIADHQQPQSLTADNQSKSLDSYQPVLVDNGDDANTSRSEEHGVAVQIHSNEGEGEKDAPGLDTRPESPSSTGTTTTRFMSPSISYSSVLQVTAILSSTDMERLVPKLAEIEREVAGQHISVPVPDVNLADIQDRVDMDDENWQYTSIRYDAGPKGQGYASICISDSKPSIDWSAFTTEVRRPTAEEARDIFENTIQNPPDGEIPYCVGHANILSDKPLDPGSIIMGNPAFKDLRTQYHHIGGHLSANRIRCEEMTSVEQTSTGLTYRGLRSYNEVYFGTGYKLWLAIAKHHIAKFDTFVKANWSCNKCNQAVSHQNLLLAPSRLKKEGIDYIIAVVGRGEAFWTLPGQQHTTINFGYSAARSINYSHPADKLDFKSVIQCFDCGMFEVGKEYGAITALALALGSRRRPLLSTSPNRKRKAHQELSKTPWKMRERKNTITGRELAKIEGQLTATTYRSPRIDRQNPSPAELDVYKRAAAVRSRLAIQQFFGLVREWRQKGSSTVTVDPTGHSLDQAVAVVKHCTGKARLQMLRLRLAQRRFAQETDKLKGPIQMNHQPAFLHDLASRHGMTKTELQGHLYDGRQWDRVCGPYDGLLPFILLDIYNDFGITKREWIMLGRREHIGETDAFHSLLNDEYIRNLSAAGKVFEEMISGAPMVFLWEEGGLDPAADNADVLLKQYLVK